MNALCTADAAADVLAGVAGVGAPGRVAEQESEGPPAVDAERAIAQRGDGPVHRLAMGALGAGVDQECGAQGAGQLVVGELRCRAQELRRVLAREAHHAQGAGEHLDVEHRVVGVGDVRYEQAALALAEELRFGVGPGDGGQALVGAGVVVGAGRQFAQDPADLGEQASVPSQWRGTSRIWPATQLWPELFILLVTMCSAWKRKSLVAQPAASVNSPRLQCCSRWASPSPPPPEPARPTMALNSE
ncbi:hypothetical protein [Streptomyces sp. NPDC055060]